MGTKSKHLPAMCDSTNPGQQVCKMCGRPQDEVDYTVAEHSWRAVVPHRWNGRALCLACFERCALDRNVHVVKVFLVNGP